MSSLRIRLFGSLELVRDTEPVARFPTQSVKHLFSYILLHRHTLHAREHLAELFWGDRDPQRARHALNTALWRLQRVLDGDASRRNPYLLVDAQSIGFNGHSAVALDVAEFEQWCALADQLEAPSAEQQATLYKQAIALYRADLLTDCYEDWCLVERQRLQHMYLRALSRVFAFHAARREHNAAIEIGQRILACDPLREEVHRDLIRCYLAAQQPAAALQQYRACESLLARELGIAPMPETQALLPQMLAAPQTHFVQPAATVADAVAQLQAAIVTLEAARLRVEQATELVERAMAQPLPDPASLPIENSR